MDFDRSTANSISRDAMLRSIERALAKLTDKELEAVYYDLLTKDYIKE